VKWIKHMVDSHNDESLCRLMDEYGLEGYGAYWLVLETIAAQCDKSDKTSITLSVKNWRKIVPFAPQKLTKWLAFAQQLTLFCVEIRENLITVSCPKLLKYRDEYSERRARKSGECRGNLPSELDIELELKQSPGTPEAGPPGHEGDVVEEKPGAEPNPPHQAAPKGDVKDPRPAGCPPEMWAHYLRISRGYHRDRANQLGRQAPSTEGKIVAGAVALDNLIRLKDCPEAEVLAVLGWASENDFWSTNLRSISALLKKSSNNGELKYSNVLTAMNRDLEHKRAGGGINAS